MTHNEQRGHWTREGQIAIATGALYGAVHTISGHPLDNIKAALQMDKSMHGLGMLQAARTMWRRDGVLAFWRGCVPPLWGSAVYRSLMMASYEASYTYLEKTTPSDSFLKKELLGFDSFFQKIFANSITENFQKPRRFACFVTIVTSSSINFTTGRNCWAALTQSYFFEIQKQRWMAC